jgi:SAM-dependent methyltransferase
MALFSELKASLAARACPVCGSNVSKGLLVDQKIDWQQLNEFAFASRKDPELMSWRMVRCQTCDVAYAVEAPGSATLIEAYHEADYDSSEEADFAARSYGQALAPFAKALPRRDSAMEIGAGNGAFLAQLIAMGFGQVVGYEPSVAAIALASPQIKPLIVNEIMDPAKIAPQSFDFVGCFQTLEHVRDPLQIARDVHKILREDGMVAFITHNYRGTLNRLLGRRSPIIDIEHLQLFSLPSIRALLENSGFSGIKVMPFWNRYPLRYWMRLLPLPLTRKRALIGLANRTGLGGIPVAANVGNMLSIGYKSK